MSKKTNRSTKIVLRQLAATAAVGTMMVAPLAPTVNVLAKSVTSSQSSNSRATAQVSGTGTVVWNAGSATVPSGTTVDFSAQGLANAVAPVPTGATAAQEAANANWINVFSNANYFNSSNMSAVATGGATVSLTNDTLLSTGAFTISGPAGFSQ